MDTKAKEKTVDSMSSNKEIFVFQNEKEAGLEQQFCQCEFCIKRLDNLERQINITNELRFRLSEKILTIENRKNYFVSKNDPNAILSGTPTSHRSYIVELFKKNCLPGLHNIAEGGMPMLHQLMWIFIHIIALLISTTFIQGAYHNWQNALIVQSVVYTNLKDIPYPAVTICEPLLLKESYNRFEILKRCVSEESEKPWLCSEEELNMLWISNDIYPIEYDLIWMNESDGENMKKLFNPMFSYSKEFLPGILNRTFSGTDYFKYINILGKERVNNFFRVADTDASGSHNHKMVNISISQAIIMAPKERDKDGFYTCRTINGKWHGPQERTTKDMPVSKNISKIGFNEEFLICNPSSIIEDACKTEIFFSDRHLDIIFEDAIDDHIPRSFTEEVASLVDNRISFARYYVFTHSYFDYPSITNLRHQRLGRHNEIVSIYSPKFINAVKDLNEVEFSKRKCIFSYEKKLSLFEFYTQQNCIFECQINCTLSLCGCIPYTTAIFNSSFKVCSNKMSEDCHSKSKFLHWYEFKDNRCKCDCPGDCVSLYYRTQLNSDGYWSDRKTTYQITPEEDVTISMVRYSMASPAEFVAYCLGILGVFNGFSMMLVWNVLYGLTLSLWSTVREILRDSPQ